MAFLGWGARSRRFKSSRPDQLTSAQIRKFSFLIMAFVFPQSVNQFLPLSPRRRRFNVRAAKAIALPADQYPLNDHLNYWNAALLD
jgi:hypothetical protein